MGSHRSEMGGVVAGRSSFVCGLAAGSGANTVVRGLQWRAVLREEVVGPMRRDGRPVKVEMTSGRSSGKMKMTSGGSSEKVEMESGRSSRKVEMRSGRSSGKVEMTFGRSSGKGEITLGRSFGKAKMTSG
ncbi:hypothetical protein RYX36_004988 [Vicia faba]